MSERPDTQGIVAQTSLDGRYRLIERIAVGGTGEVWRAADELLEHRVAVKILRHRYTADEELRSRFRAEARHAAMLSHPGIARVYNYGEQDGIAYLVMEYLSGKPLSELVRAEPLSPDWTMEIVGQVARAIQVAHDAGVIHRDIKPANLIVNPDRVVKVTDFGTARVLDADTLTQPGMVVGTAYYLSPEQAQGLQLTPATDIYSLGVVAYECLTGQPPFPGTLPDEVAFAHIHDLPPELPSRVPDEVRGLVRQCLDKSPARRPSSMAELAQLADRARGQNRGRHAAARTVLAAGASTGERGRQRLRIGLPGRDHPLPAGRGVLAGALGLSIAVVGGLIVSSSVPRLPMVPNSDNPRQHTGAGKATDSRHAGPPVSSSSSAAPRTDEPSSATPSHSKRHTASPDPSSTHHRRPSPHPTHPTPTPTPTRTTPTPSPTSPTRRGSPSPPRLLPPWNSSSPSQS